MLTVLGPTGSGSTTLVSRSLSRSRDKKMAKHLLDPERMEETGEGQGRGEEGDTRG